MFNCRREQNEQKTRAEKKKTEEIGFRLEMFRRKYLVRFTHQTELPTNHYYY